jgi:PleD family two-component response regulator
MLERVAPAVAAQASGPLDLCAHFGGPQFALLLPQADAAAASVRAVSLIDSVARLGLTHGEGAARRSLTACVGGVTADFMLIDPTLRVRPHEMTLTAMRALEEAAAEGYGQVSLQRWEMAPASL